MNHGFCKYILTGGHCKRGNLIEIKELGGLCIYNIEGLLIYFTMHKIKSVCPRNIYMFEDGRRFIIFGLTENMGPLLIEYEGMEGGSPPLLIDEYGQLVEYESMKLTSPNTYENQFGAVILKSGKATYVSKQGARTKMAIRSED